MDLVELVLSVGASSIALAALTKEWELRVAIAYNAKIARSTVSSNPKPLSSCLVMGLGRDRSQVSRFFIRKEAAGLFWI